MAMAAFQMLDDYIAAMKSHRLLVTELEKKGRKLEEGTSTARYKLQNIHADAKARLQKVERDLAEKRAAILRENEIWIASDEHIAAVREFVDVEGYDGRIRVPRNIPEGRGRAIRDEAIRQGLDAIYGNP